MALSQLQCLDDNHVNPRTHESKPEFLYCENQRLALETLLRDGREAFIKYLKAHSLRGFLSDPELETLAGSVEPYDPNSELFPEGAGDDEPPLSLHYWPELSDTSIPQMDLGWPDCDAYRGVTRTTVYAQPPLDGQTHIKEVVRKMIAQAQKVIAVVMDVFTDVDIFRDLLDAGFKRRVSVYILLEHATLPHFLSMCQRANMHAGHLKHLRVRFTEGVDFYTRSSTKVRGRMGHRFMFIDGDKAVSGSYSFTWMSSRLERNLITVVTGQAVDAFDRLFRTLYGTSSSVNLRKVATGPEPEPEPLPQPASVAPPSTAVARKLYNPKYALALGSPSPSPTPPADNSSLQKPQIQDNSKNPEVPETKKRKRRRASKEAMQEVPPIHPGLINLEKACLMSYLPTWPEPDPPSDVIGFINIRDTSKPTQVHLQRSEMFGTSQAIRFSSPISMPKETLPEVAMPRQSSAKHEELNNIQQAQVKTKAEKSVIDRAQPTQLNAQPGDIKSKVEAPEQNSPGTNLISGLKFESDKDNTKTLNTEDKLHSHTPTNQKPGHNTTEDLSAHSPPQSSSKISTPNTGRPSLTTKAVPTQNPKPDPLPGLNTEQGEETTLNTQSAVAYWTHTLESHCTQSSHQCDHADSNSGQHTQTQTMLPHIDSHTQSQHSSEVTQTPTLEKHVSPYPTSVSSTSFSETNNVSITTTTATSACTPLSSISSTSSLPPPSSSSTTPNHPLLSSSTSSSLTPTPPIPKPRTVQLVIKDSVTRDGQKLPEFSVVKRPETSMGPQVVHTAPTVATVVQILPEKEPETVSQLENNSESKTEAQKDAENRENIIVAPQKNQSGTSCETKNEEALGLHDGKVEMQLVAETKPEAQSDVLITDAPKTDSVNIPKDVEPQTLTSMDCKLTPKIDCAATIETDTEDAERAPAGSESAGVPNENRKNVTQGKTYHANALDVQRISYCELTPKDISVLETVDTLKASTHSPATHNSHMSKDIAGDSTPTSAVDADGQQGNPSHTLAKSMSNSSKQNPCSNIQELNPKARGGINTPERPLHLHLTEIHMPDFRSPMPDREFRSLTAPVRTPTPDGFPQCTPTPDSGTHTPDSRSYTPDFRTPTSDVSDGWISPRPDSALSTTSEEYYECIDSPSQEPVFDQAFYRNLVMKEDRVSFTLTNTPNAATIATSPAHINCNTYAATIGTVERNTSNSETQSLSRPSSVSSTSSLLESKVTMAEEEEDTVNEENGREVDEKGKELSVAQRSTEGSEEANRTADHFRQSKSLTETVEINKDTQPQVPKRKSVLNQSGAEKLVDGEATPGKLTNKGADPKRLSTGDLKPKKDSSSEERPDKEKFVDRATLAPSDVERRGRPQSTRQPETQKRMHTPPRLPRGQMPDSKVSSPSRPSRPPRSASAGARSLGSRQLNQTDSKALQSSFQVLDNTLSSRRPPPPIVAGAVGSTAGHKQGEVSRSQQSLLSRQPLTVQARMRGGQSLSRHSYPKPPASFLHTHSNMLHSHSQHQTVSAQEAHGQEEGKAPFSFTFSRLYNLKGLKDKMSKLPAQSKRGSISSPVQGRKSTS